MCSTVMKGLRFPNTQESCFEAWKHSYMGCSALLCVRFDDYQESHFQATKRSNIGSAVQLGCRSADFPNYVFKLQNVQIWTVTDCKRGLFADCQEWHFQAANRSDKSSTILQLC